MFLVRHVLFATLATKLFRARALAALGPQALEWFRQEGPTGAAKRVIVPPGTEVSLRALPLSEWEEEIALVAGLADAWAASGSNSWAPLPLEVRVAMALATLLAHEAADIFGQPVAWDGLLTQALSRAAAALEGISDLRWGARHHAMPMHVLYGFSAALDGALAVPFPEMSGDHDCVLQGAGPNGLFDDALVASTARYVFDLSGFGAGGWVVPLGASGHPASPHFADQQRAWVDGELLPIIADWTQLAREAEATQQLEPEAG